MLAEFYIPRLSNDMKLALQKSHLGSKFCTEIWTLLKNGVNIYFDFLTSLFRLEDFSFRSFSSSEIFLALAAISMLATDPFLRSLRISFFIFFRGGVSSIFVELWLFVGVSLRPLSAVDERFDFARGDFATETCRGFPDFSASNSRLISSMRPEVFSSFLISELLRRRWPDRPRFDFPGDRSAHFSWWEEPREDRRKDFGSDLSDFTESRSGELELARVSCSRPRREERSRIDFLTRKT